MASLEKEFKQIDRHLTRRINQAEKEIGRDYSVLRKELRDEIGKWYALYATGGVLVYSELTKYDRIKKFNATINKVVGENYTDIAREIRSAGRSSIKVSFNVTMDAVGKKANRKIRGIMKPEIANAILQSPHSGLTLNERLQGRRADIQRSIREVLTRGFNQGLSYDQMAAVLSEPLEKDYAKAMRIVRTECHRVTEAAKGEALDHAAKQGVKMKHWWLHSDDERVRISHLFMGEEYSKENMIPYEDEFTNPRTGGRGVPGNMGTAADDCNCRCLRIAEIVGVR